MNITKDMCIGSIMTILITTVALNLPVIAQETPETVYDYALAHHEKEWTKCDACTPDMFAKTKYRIGFVLESLSHPLLVKMKEDAEAVAAQYPNIELLVLLSEDDIAKQASDVYELLAQKVDALLIQSANAPELAGALKQADAMGIPYFFCLKGLKESNAVAQALAGYSLEGKMMGEFIVEQFPDSANIVFIEGIPGDQSSIARCRQIRMAIAANPKIKVLASRPGFYRQEPSMAVMDDFIHEFPKIDFVFGANDAAALGALLAIRHAGLLDQIKVGGIDAEKAALESIKAGGMLVTFTHSKGGHRGKTLAGVGMNMIIDYFSGKEIPRWYVSESEIVTKENVEQIKPFF